MKLLQENSIEIDKKYIDLSSPIKTLGEHKIDIERAMLFGMKGSQGGVQYSDGIAGSIIKSGTANIVNDGSQLSYNEKKSYLKSFQKSLMHLIMNTKVMLIILLNSLNSLRFLLHF